jgi:hypothetical protein
VTVEATALADIWLDLGMKWRILEQYFKPYPVCRWAQPAMEAAQTLMRRYAIETDDIASVEIETFGHAVRLGARLPATTEAAQYAIGFPVAALLAHDRLGAAEIATHNLGDASVREVAERIVLGENADFTRRFPAERLAIVAIRRRDGSIVSSGPTLSRGDPNAPLTDQEILSKFTNLAADLPASERLLIQKKRYRTRHRRGRIDPPHGRGALRRTAKLTRVHPGRRMRLERKLSNHLVAGRGGQSIRAERRGYARVLAHGQSQNRGGQDSRFALSADNESIISCL